ncbi:MAG: RHS repeat-associated core domain-containing protein, partial [Lachnospiraceae bacterium]|nr:RHS repeat-associated core domain-containing protein [Lachnospiraceae bacterium]
MTYDKNNRLLTYNGENVKYDKDGNMTYGPLQGRMTEFAFDCRNRLVKAGDTVYEYDAENNRIAVTTGTKRTEYVVNSQPELSQVLQSTVRDTANKAAQPETTYYFYGKRLISQENKTDGYLTYHFNNVGSTMAVTNQKGEVVKEYAYSPYGELLLGESDGSIQFLYNGQFGVTTDANGLYYMRTRYYNVDIKRFVNQDVLTGTLERISSLNRYAYVEGNPVSFLDPFGLEKNVVDTLHEMIEKIQQYITVAMIGLSVAAAISFALGAYVITYYSAAWFDTLNSINTILTAINFALYT